MPKVAAAIRTRATMGSHQLAVPSARRLGMATVETMGTYVANSTIMMNIHSGVAVDWWSSLRDPSEPATAQRVAGARKTVTDTSFTATSFWVFRGERRAVGRYRCVEDQFADKFYGGLVRNADIASSAATLSVVPLTENGSDRRAAAGG